MTHGTLYPEVLEPIIQCTGLSISSNQPGDRFNIQPFIIKRFQLMTSKRALDHCLIERRMKRQQRGVSRPNSELFKRLGGRTSLRLSLNANVMNQDIVFTRGLFLP